jgi:FlgN protein
MNPQLATSFRTAIGDYVARVEAVQADLLAAYRRKRAALAAADTAVLREIEPLERQAAERLKALVGERHQMLVRAGQFGTPHGSLADVANALACDPAVLARLASCRKRAATLRREGWVHWVVAKRSLAQTGALLDLIAHRGDRSPTYDKPTGRPGGTLLDASA